MVYTALHLLLIKCVNVSQDVHQSELGQLTAVDTTYNPGRLYPIARTIGRRALGLTDEAVLPFYGVDYWNHYEVSWLNEQGKPIVALAEMSYDCHSPFLIESKSLKLYFNSLNDVTFSSAADVCGVIKHDLEHVLQTNVTVKIYPLEEREPTITTAPLAGECLDNLAIDCHTYDVNPAFLVSEGHDIIEETLYSNLLKSNCPVTNQPDWGSVQIHYKGRAIQKSGLLRYIVSYRHHQGFHEQCIEQLFLDILTHCQPEILTVYGRYTRRGGLDINPYRSTLNQPDFSANQRLSRQ